MRQIALDTETTGFDPEEGHRLVEIGCVEMVDMVRTGRTFHVYVDPERDMPESAFKVHGLSREFLRDKPKFREVADPFLEFIGEDQLVIHNAAFDMRFLNAELKKLGKPALPMERSLDTVLLARKLFPGAQVNLNALCNRFGIDLSRRTFHGALLDAELLCDVYLELNGGRQTTLLSGEIRVEKKRAEYEAFDPRQLQQMHRDFSPSPEEQAAHLAFVKKKLKNAIWAKYLNLEGA